MGTMVYDNKGSGDNDMLIDIVVLLINQKMYDETEIHNWNILFILIMIFIVIMCNIINQ